MEIEEIKTWQWVLAGLVAGLLFSCVVAWRGPSFDTQPRDTIEQGEFENGALALTKFAQQFRMQRLLDAHHKGLPMLRSVTVHPPIASDPKTYWITGEMFSIDVKPDDPTKIGSAGKIAGEWKAFKYPASVPYEPGYTRREEKKLDRGTLKNTLEADLKKSLGGKANFPTAVEYLNAVAALPGSTFKPQYAWWERTVPIWTLPPLAGVLMIGVAWPLTLSAMRTFGLAKPAHVKAKPTAVRRPVRPTNTAMPAGVVLKPVTPVAPPVPTEHKEYGGEFYPVVKTTHKE
jgi:hypothetical protein